VNEAANANTKETVGGMFISEREQVKQVFESFCQKGNQFRVELVAQAQVGKSQIVLECNETRDW